MRLILIALGVIFALAKPSQGAQTLITILTGSPSGIYYPLGTALSSIYAKAVPGASVTVQATAGSVQNLKLLEAGDGELGFTLGDSLADAWAGNKEAGFDAPLSKLRAIARIYPNFIQIVASNRSGIKTLADLKGKRVSVGAEGSGTALNAAAIFKAAGFTSNDLAKVDHTPFGSSVRLVEQGSLDATLQSAGLGVESIRHLLASGQSRLIPIPADVVAKVGSPVYVPATIPAGTYEGQPADVPTASVPNFLVTRAGVSDDAASLMTKSLFEHLDQLVETHPAAKDIDVKQATTDLPVPLHPGAERYYREVGIIK
ncbi:MAG: TAXI family TRAP transporter solute-binding subunit [Acetobacteraceae bacterium]|nr:TAXI family TRAP transporter solute-binding subunit [Acetobacteraceae bacterium]